jgi:hypothetical protein
MFATNPAGVEHHKQAGGANRKSPEFANRPTPDSRSPLGCCVMAVIVKRPPHRKTLFSRPLSSVEVSLSVASVEVSVVRRVGLSPSFSIGQSAAEQGDFSDIG